MMTDDEEEAANKEVGNRARAALKAAVEPLVDGERLIAACVTFLYSGGDKYIGASGFIHATSVADRDLLIEAVRQQLFPDRPPSPHEQRWVEAVAKPDKN